MLSENIAERKAVVDWLTTIAIASIAVSLMVGFHEGVHALSCVVFFVWFALKELGKIIGGDANEQIGRATKLGMISYFTAVLVTFLAGLLHPYGMGSLPVIAGLLAVAGGLSPLLWMMQWFRAASFVKLPGPPLEIHRKLSWIIVAAVVVFVYVVILGRTLYF